MSSTVKPTLPRKRNRKRKRRVDFSSSSSSSSSSESSDDSGDEKTVTLPTPKQELKAKADEPSESSTSSSSSDSSSSDSDSDNDERPVNDDASKTRPSSVPAPREPSPPPPSAAIPSFIPENGAGNTNEQEMKKRFRKFWMSSVADGFRDDLEEIRKEPNLTTTKLSLLIDSLASGAEVFTSSNTSGASSNTQDINEMEMVLG